MQQECEKLIIFLYQSPKLLRDLLLIDRDYDKQLFQLSNRNYIYWLNVS